MAAVFHIGDQGGESRLKQALLDHLNGKWSVMDFVAVSAVVRVSTRVFIARNDLD